MTEPDEEIRDYIRKLFQEPAEDEQHPVPQPPQDNRHDHGYRKIARHIFNTTDD